MAAPLPIEEEFRGPPTPLIERYFTTYYAVGASTRVCKCTNLFVLRTNLQDEQV